MDDHEIVGHAIFSTLNKLIEVIRMKLIGRVSILIILLFSVVTELQPIKADNGSKTNHYVFTSQESPDRPLLLQVTLKRHYLDGETSEETLQETIWKLEDFWAKYESWQLVDMDEERIVFETFIDDISPLLKVNGFFGITKDGTLSIFNGTPEQADIIQSFFQIDMEKLEGRRRQQLEQGIPIKSKEVFSDVLKTMKQYSIDKESK